MSDDSQQTPSPAKRDTTSPTGDAGTPASEHHDVEPHDVEPHVVEPHVVEHQDAEHSAREQRDVEHHDVENHERGHLAREHHSGAVERARADLAAGRAWKARDRLTGHLTDNLDPEALELLGEVHYAMGDMPAAGAAWFGTGRRGKDVDEAVEAWRERHNDHFDQMWRSLPRTVRDNPGNPRVEALRRRAGADRTPSVPVSKAPSSGGNGVDAAVVITVVLAILFVICAIVGAVTVLRWMLPG